MILNYIVKCSKIQHIKKSDERRRLGECNVHNNEGTKIGMHHATLIAALTTICHIDSRIHKGFLSYFFIALPQFFL